MIIYLRKKCFKKKILKKGGNENGTFQNIQ